MNALGAVAVGLEVGIPFAKIASGFSDFRGAERRFQMRGERGGRDRRGRLRPPPDRDRRGDRRARGVSTAGWSSCSSRTATRGRATASKISASAFHAADEIVLTESTPPARRRSRARPRGLGGWCDDGPGDADQGDRRHSGGHRKRPKMRDLRRRRAGRDGRSILDAREGKRTGARRSRRSPPKAGDEAELDARSG